MVAAGGRREEADELGALEGAGELAGEAGGVVLDPERALDVAEPVGRAVRGACVDRERSVEIRGRVGEVRRACVMAVCDRERLAIRAGAGARLQFRDLVCAKPGGRGANAGSGENHSKRGGGGSERDCRAKSDHE